MMFRHVVMFRFVPTITAEQRAAVLDGLARLPDAVEEVRTFSVGSDAGLDEANFAIVVIAEFDDREGYLAYAAHPAHRRLVTDVVGPVITERVAVQYEIDDIPPV